MREETFELFGSKWTIKYADKIETDDDKRFQLGFPDVGIFMDGGLRIQFGLINVNLTLIGKTIDFARRGLQELDVSSVGYF